MRAIKTTAFLLCVAALCFMRPLGSIAATTWQVVVRGLDNPRGLAFGPEGALYIAQAGRGGDGLCGPGPEASGATATRARSPVSIQRRVPRAMS